MHKISVDKKNIKACRIIRGCALSGNVIIGRKYDSGNRNIGKAEERNMVTHSGIWFVNAINYVLGGKTEVVNYWCSLEELQRNITKGEVKFGGPVEVSLEDSKDYMIFSEVIAYGRKKGSRRFNNEPPLNVTTRGSVGDITLGDIYKMKIDNNANLLVKNYNVKLGVNIVPVDNTTLNALNSGTNLKDFKSEVNSTLSSMYRKEENDPLAYLILRPLKIIANGFFEEKKQEEIEKFNRKHQEELEKSCKKVGWEWHG